jgi:hypothetical protein
MTRLDDVTPLTRGNGHDGRDLSNEGSQDLSNDERAVRQALIGAVDDVPMRSAPVLAASVALRVSEIRGRRQARLWVGAVALSGALSAAVFVGTATPVPPPYVSGGAGASHASGFSGFSDFSDFSGFSGFSTFSDLVRSSALLLDEEALAFSSDDALLTAARALSVGESADDDADYDDDVLSGALSLTAADLSDEHLAFLSRALDDRLRL